MPLARLAGGKLNRLRTAGPFVYHSSLVSPPDGRKTDARPHFMFRVGTRWATCSMSLKRIGAALLP
jgi:hypothetical protein